MSEQRYEALILSAIYNLEKNYGKLPSQALIPMVIDQLKSALKQIDADVNKNLKALGLKPIALTEEGEE